jgi:hypothetical protein
MLFGRPLKGKGLNAELQPCEYKRQCASKWCDKKGKYTGSRWTCFDLRAHKKAERIKAREEQRALAAAALAGASSDGGDGGGSSNAMVLIAVFLVAIGSVLVVAVLMSHSRNKSKNEQQFFGSGGYPQSVVSSAVSSSEQSATLLCSSAKNSVSGNMFDNMSEMLADEDQRSASGDGVVPSRLATIRAAGGRPKEYGQEYTIATPV